MSSRDFEYHVLCAYGSFRSDGRERSFLACSTRQEVYRTCDVLSIPSMTLLRCVDGQNLYTYFPLAGYSIARPSILSFVADGEGVTRVEAKVSVVDIPRDS